MTIASVMGTEPPRHVPWRSSARRRDDPRPGQDGPSDNQDGGAPNQTDPSSFPLENDLALARMLGCAMLVGIGSIVGLLMLIF